MPVVLELRPAEDAGQDMPKDPQPNESEVVNQSHENPTDSEFLVTYCEPGYGAVRVTKGQVDD
jgi:hypothetical protein